MGLPTQAEAQSALLALARVDTPRTAPAVLDLHVLIALVTLETVGLLLDDSRMRQSSGHGVDALCLSAPEPSGKGVNTTE